MGRVESGRLVGWLMCESPWWPNGWMDGLHAGGVRRALYSYGDGGPRDIVTGQLKRVGSSALLLGMGSESTVLYG